MKTLVFILAAVMLCLALLGCVSNSKLMYAEEPDLTIHTSTPTCDGSMP